MLDWAIIHMQMPLSVIHMTSKWLDLFCVRIVVCNEIVFTPWQRSLLHLSMAVTAILCCGKQGWEHVLVQTSYRKTQGCLTSLLEHSPSIGQGRSVVEVILLKILQAKLLDSYRNRKSTIRKMWQSLLSNLLTAASPVCELHHRNDCGLPQQGWPSGPQIHSTFPSLVGQTPGDKIAQEISCNAAKYADMHSL